LWPVQDTILSEASILFKGASLPLSVVTVCVTLTQGQGHTIPFSTLLAQHEVSKLIVVDPAAAISVYISDHVINVLLSKVISQVLQDPPELADVDLSLLVLV